MAPNRGLLFLSLFSIARATDPTRPLVQWGACPETAQYANATAPIECGTLRVPLDYTQPESNVLYDIALVKVPAKTQPAKGTIQMNYGGPGGPALAPTVLRGAELQTLTGGVYDIVGFDPRGVDVEMPFFCSNESSSIATYASWIVDASQSEQVAKKLWATAGATGGRCQREGTGEAIGELIGTVFVARDIAQIAEALDEDGLIRFWGLSYGTALGATIAAMFPDRIDRMVIDGVLNPFQYYNDLADYDEWIDTDKVFTYFFTSCLEAGPTLCPLAALNKTAAELEADAWSFIDAVTDAPIAIPSLDTFIDGLFVKSNFFQASYNTDKFPAFAAQLATLLYGTQEDWIEALAPLYPPRAPVSLGLIEPFWGIHCSDRTVRADNYEEMAPVNERLFGLSKIQGGAHAASAAICARWPYHAKEAYTGNFEVQTKQPVLVLSNSLDAQTAIAAARNVSATLEGSVLLEVDVAGHCTYSAPSSCTARYLQEYWVEGTLPAEGTVCERDAGAWE